MKKTGIVIGSVALPVFFVFFVSCSNPKTPDGKITESDAIAIAKKQVPARIAGSYVITGFRQEASIHGAWFVSFPNVNTSREELGWKENDITFFLTGDNYTWEKDIPQGTYRNITVYIDADTGDVIRREANNELIIGGDNPG
jgi:hypothetical protein